MKFTEASNLNDSLYGKNAAPIRLFMEKRAQAWEQESMIDKIFSVEKSENWGEHVTGMTAATGFMPVGENGAHPKDSIQEGYGKTFKHMTWKDSLEISREMVDDNKIMDLKKRPRAFVDGYYRTREEFAAALIAGAIAGKTSITFRGKTFDCTGADELCVFHTEHPCKVRGDAQSNIFSNGFSVQALTKVQAEMNLFRGDNNEVLNVAPTTIIIPVDEELKTSVFQAIGSREVPGTPNHGNNIQMGMWNVITWPYLNQFLEAGLKPWILLDETYNEDGGNMWFDRVELEVKQRLAENDALVHDGYARWSAGFADWRQMAVGGIPAGVTL